MPMNKSELLTTSVDLPLAQMSETAILHHLKKRRDCKTPECNISRVFKQPMMHMKAAH